MALRKKGLKVAVTAMAIISVITSGGLNNIYADGSIDKNITVIERTLEDKVYSVANKIEYVNRMGMCTINIGNFYGKPDMDNIQVFVAGRKFNFDGYVSLLSATAGGLACSIALLFVNKPDSNKLLTFSKSLANFLKAKSLSNSGLS